jgi:peroxiredoxin family protein
MVQNQKMHTKKPLVIFAHSDSYDRLHQVASMALTAAVTGRQVVVVFFFWALRALVRGGLDEKKFSAVSAEAAAGAAARLAVGNNPPPSEMLAMARETGQVKFYACSASMQYMGLELEETARAVDEVVGMSTILRLTLDGPNLVYI